MGTDLILHHPLHSPPLSLSFFVMYGPFLHLSNFISSFPPNSSLPDVLFPFIGHKISLHILSHPFTLMSPTVCPLCHLHPSCTPSPPFFFLLHLWVSGGSLTAEGNGDAPSQLGAGRPSLLRVSSPHLPPLLFSTTRLSSAGWKQRRW